MADLDHQEYTASCQSRAKENFDYFLWGSLLVVAILYLSHVAMGDYLESYDILESLTSSSYELMNKVWWGMAIGVVMVGIVSKIPQDFITYIMGDNKGLKGLIRATVAGIFLDLCSHGILMIGVKLYQKGLSIGQMMAFLIASPWNSFSLTFILIALIGLKWTLLFILLSMLIAIITGMVFNKLEISGLIPTNPNSATLAADFDFAQEFKSQSASIRFNPTMILGLLREGLLGSKIVIKWTFFGVILASLIRTFVSTEHFHQYFGPTAFGLAATLLVSTVIEVCSEGASPIAADILTRANAPGNSFAFLMTGVATDYTEILSIRSATQSWLIALLLPVITVPQVILVAWLINS